ncbi:MAG TPA: RsmB/NOP family class I SAM-dependent RNA methyltransferase [Bacteroidia bacterium]|nr:RsmB/NOP family class I SAM-dependent RNA methyltransferase [Bacteroidia bacterium]
MTEATNLMRRAAAVLFPDSSGEQAAFLDALLHPAPHGNAVLWTVPRRPGALETVPKEELPSWFPEAAELIAPGTKIGRTAAYEAGEVYPLDFSSVATGSAMLAAKSALPDAPRVLDLCAAPGGKSLLASVLLGPALLLSNEVEGKRLGMLRHNLARCRVPHAFTQRLSPEEIASLAPEGFDLCLADAPCSGQSLLAKGTPNPGCFHPATVKGNARRQLRILESALRTVRPGGFVLYTTCTFDRRENEGVLEKLSTRTPGFGLVEVPHLAEYRSTLSDLPSYRVYPHRSPGAGGFAALLRKTGEPGDGPPYPLPPVLTEYPILHSD